MVDLFSMYDRVVAVKAIPKYGKVEKSMTDILLLFRHQTDNLCEDPLDCNTASKMITTLNNVSFEIHPPVLKLETL